MEVDVAQADGSAIAPATDVSVAPDGSLVVTLDELDVSAVVRVAGAEVVSRAVLPGSALAVLPRADGSIAVVASEDHAPGIRVAVVPPGGDPGEVVPVDARRTTPELALGHEFGDGYAVLAPDGRTVVLLHDDGDRPVLTAIDPDSGEVRGSRPLTEWSGSEPLGLLLTDGGSGLAVVLGSGGPDPATGAAVVLRLGAVLPGDLPAALPPPQALPGVVPPGGVALGAGDAVAAIVRTRPSDPASDVVSLVVVPAEGRGVRTAAVLPSGHEEFPNGDWEDVLVSPDGARAWVAGEAGEDSDIGRPVLLPVDLADGTVGEPEYLSEAGSTGSMALLGDALVVPGHTAVRTELTPTSVIWYRRT